MISNRMFHIEELRKPLSRLFAVAVVLWALTIVPQSFNSLSHQLLEFTGFAMLAAAAVGRVWCSIYISGRKNSMLCVQGPYSISRNPLYLFSFIGVMGFGLALQSISLFLILSVAFLLYYRWVIVSEERRLSGLFGTEYEIYKAETPRFFPAFRKPSTPETYSVSPRIIEKSIKEVVWFLLVIVLVEILETVHAGGHMILWKSPF